MATRRGTPERRPGSGRPAGAGARRPRPPAAARTTPRPRQDRVPAAAAPPAPPPPRTGASLTGRAAVLVLVLAVLAVSYAYPLRSWFEQRQRIADLRAEKARLAADIAELERQTARWDDPAYVQAQARQRLSFVKPGEVGFTVIGGSPEGSATPGGPAAVSEDADESPWWSRVWDTVERADEPIR